MPNKISKNKKFSRKNSGIIALFPAIVLSGFLLFLIIGSSQTFLSMLERASLTDDRSQSVSLAQLCLRRAIAKKMQNSTYFGGETINLFGYNCTIKSFAQNQSGENMAQNIEVLVTVNDAQSTDTATFDPTTQTILNENIF